MQNTSPLKGIIQTPLYIYRWYHTFNSTYNQAKSASEWMLFNAMSVFFQLYHGENKYHFDYVDFVQDQHVRFDFYNASSLKQNANPIGHITSILIPSQTVFALFSSCIFFIREAANSNFIIFGLIRRGFVTIICSIGARTLTYTWPMQNIAYL